MRFRILVPGDEKILLRFLRWLTPEAYSLWFHYGRRFDKRRVKEVLQEFNTLKIAGFDMVRRDISFSFLRPRNEERMVILGHLYKIKEDSCRLGIVSGITGKGYGTLMMRKLLSSAKDLGVKKVFLSTYQDNFPALALYKKFGFKIITTYTDRVRKAYEMEVEV